MTDTPMPPDDGDVSKSQRKREARAVFDLGRELVALDASRLAAIPLDDDLRQAIRKTRSITARVAHKRELQYLAKLLRQHDTEAIAAALASGTAEQARATDRFHAVEQWRDALLADPQQAFSELCEASPALDRQHLRRLLRESQGPENAVATVTARRELFRYLRDLQLQDALPASAD